MSSRRDITELIVNETTSNQAEPEVDEPMNTPELDLDDEEIPTTSERGDLYIKFPDLEECCTANGLTQKQFVRRGDRVTTLEMFLGFWPTMQSVQYFTLLQELSIVKNPTITIIEGLESCPLLESLCIMECGLTRIQNLQRCTKLTKLNLSSNFITVIENIASLSSLQTLWLNDNQITKVSGLGDCVQLKHVWLAKNQIYHIESGIERNKVLEEVNLAANKLNSFQALQGLSKLPMLRSLSLSDPHFGDNPVCRLCNYQTYLLCLLPSLSYLDTIELSAMNKQVADTTLIKKRMYYNMRIKTIKRNLSDCLRKSRMCYIDHLNYANFNLNALMRELSDLEKEIQSEKTSSFQIYSPGALTSKRDRILSHIQLKMQHVHAMVMALDSLTARLSLLSEKTIRRLILELNTGGNIRLEDGKSSDVWYSSCVDLLKSRAFVQDLLPFGIKELKVQRVTRINNRFLRNRFQERMDELLDGPDEQVKENISKRGVTVRESKDDNISLDRTSSRENTSIENTLEYLFYMQPPVLDHVGTGCIREQDHAVEAGFRSIEDYFGIASSGIKLSNSLSVLDAPRLAAYLVSNGSDRIVDANELQSLEQFGWGTSMDFTLPMRSAQRRVLSGELSMPGGSVLIAKVFLGHTRAVERLPLPNDSSLEGLQCIQMMKPNDPKQKCYYVYDSSLILPEYLVEYEYIRMDTASQLLNMSSVAKLPVDDIKSNLDQVSDESLQDISEAFALTEAFQSKYKLTFVDPLLEQHLLEEATKNLIQMEPAIVRRQNMGVSNIITPSFLLESSSQKGLDLICELNLTSCGLKSLIGFEVCAVPNLERLNLSFNEIRKIECLEGLTALTTLDLGYNILRSLDNVATLINLKTLILNNNLLYRFEDVRALGHLQVQRLDLRNNAICEAKRYRLHVIQRLPQLGVLDMAPISRTELKTAIEMSTTLSILKIWTCSRGKRLSTSREMTSLDAYQAQQIARAQKQSSTDMEIGAFQEDGTWWSEVDELHVSHELLTKLSNLERLENLRIATFSDNDITYIDGLSKCTKLEELYLDNNQILTIENLNTLINLRVLDLGKNKLTCMKNMDALVNLKQLSLEDNEITSLNGLSHLVRLMELYIGNNSISNLKEIQHLKALPKLIIVDFSGNGFCTDEEYQLYTIYHLRRVKVLDGTSVTAELQNEAKQSYSGKLTTDFLIEKIGHAFNRIQEMELSSCRIREIGSLHGDVFINLKDLNLENNLISDISGLEKLPKLRALNLSNNKIDRLSSAGPGTGIMSCPKLENLQLARNSVTDMTLLGLHNLPDLKVLNLESNDITVIAGLSGSKELKELYLSKNKIRQFDTPPGLTMTNLILLKLDDNSLRSLTNFFSLQRLQALDLSSNRLTDLEEIERLHTSLPFIQELWIQNNPASKRHLARSTMIFRYPTLKTLDGKDITLEERERVDVLFMHDRQLLNPMLPPTLQAPTITASSKTSVKLTAMSFDSLTNSQRRKSMNMNNNPATLLPQVPQQLSQPSIQQPSSTRDEREKNSTEIKEERRKQQSVLPETFLNNNPTLNSGIHTSLNSSFASFSQTKISSRPGDALYSTANTAPIQKTPYLAQPTGHVFTSRTTRNTSLK